MYPEDNITGGVIRIISTIYMDIIITKQHTYLFFDVCSFVRGGTWDNPGVTEAGSEQR